MVPASYWTFLAVHAYEYYPPNTPSDMSCSVCKTVNRIHGSYTHIILLGGQHKPGVVNTVDQLMRADLIRYGVPPEKLIAWRSVCPQQRPPRTTAEECDLLPTVLRQITGYQPRTVAFDAVCLDSYMGVVDFLYRDRGSQLNRIVPAPSSLLTKPRGFVTKVLTQRDPDGNGRFYRKAKNERNIWLPPQGVTSWVENTRTAWDN